MPASSPIGAAEAVTRQIRRVRRRWNVHEVGHTGLLLVALVAGAAAATVLLALRMGLLGFALAGMAIALATLGAVFVLLRAAARRWLRAGSAAPTIDARAGLAGRLATLMELEAREPADDFFVPLLVEQNRTRLSLWRPEEVVPRLVPRRPLAAAAAAVAALVAALLVAPGLAPQVPEVEYSEHPLGAVDAGTLGGGRPDRIVVGSGDPPGRAGEESSPAALAVAGPTEGTQAGLAGLAAALQERIRDRFWGDGWRKVAASMARAETERQLGGHGPAHPRGGRRGEGRSERWQEARLAPGTGDEHAGPGGREPAEPSAAQRAAADATAEPGESEDGGAGGPAPAAAASGAGTGTDPRLLGEPSERLPGGNDVFALGLTAHVRGPSAAGAVRRATPPPPRATSVPPSPTGSVPRHRSRARRSPRPTRRSSPRSSPIAMRRRAHERRDRRRRHPRLPGHLRRRAARDRRASSSATSEAIDTILDRASSPAATCSSRACPASARR